MARPASVRQATLNEPIELTGIGVHNGKQVSLTLHPAEADSGVIFIRSDLDDDSGGILAVHEQVCATELCTVLGDPAGAAVSTVEHLMATLSGFGIDNAIVEVDGAELPILDGSAAAYVDAISQAGVRDLEMPRRFIKVLQPVRVDDGDSSGELVPYDGFRLDVTIDFADVPVIGRQQLVLDISAETFRTELSRARTFGFMRDVERLWAAGYAMGASLDNTVALDDGKVVNPEGPRWPDEFVRHKALDALGDLALAGAPILGAFSSLRGGHRLNYQVLKALFSRPDAWTYVELAERRDRGHAQIRGEMSHPAFSPDKS